MNKLACYTILTSLLTLTACATDPLDEQRRKDMEADIDDILTYELDPLEYGGVRDCLSDLQFRSYRALGKRHLLFYGRRNKQWVNVLRGRCPDLDDDSVIVMNRTSAGSLCEKDQFTAGSASGVASSARCFLGEFKPVTEAQVKEIEDRLEKR